MNTSTLLAKEPDSSWRNPFGIALVVYYFVMALAGMLVPDDILKSHIWAREFSDFMASIIPQIDRISALNIKPDVNRFYFSVLWAGSPALIFIVVSGALVRGVNVGRLSPDDSSFKLVAAGVAGTVICMIAMTMPFAESSSQLMNGLIRLSMGRGLLGQILLVNGPIIFLTVFWINVPYFVLTGQYAKAMETQLGAKSHATDNDQVGSRNA